MAIECITCKHYRCGMFFERWTEYCLKLLFFRSGYKSKKKTGVVMRKKDNRKLWSKGTHCPNFERNNLTNSDA